MNNIHEHLIQHSLKSGGTNDHFRPVKYLALPFIERPAIVKIVKKYTDPQTTTPTNNREKFEPSCYISSVRYKQRIIHRLLDSGCWTISILFFTGTSDKIFDTQQIQTW